MFELKVNDDITLRMLSARDSEALFRITDESRGYLKRWLPWLDSIRTSHDSLEFIKNTFHSYNNRTGITSGIFLHGELVGIIGYNYLDFRNKIGSIGYWLSENQQGKGIMTVSIRALIHYGFENLKLNRIEIRIAEQNIQSQKVVNRIGFYYEGHIRDAEWLYDHYVDHFVYSMLKKEWIHS
ncbi:MAG TPA: GNAT family protein [Pseudogracilibacillus sp.]|nr:GNAT family protein [Pseudogracilibacillus sp.]